MAVFSCMYYIAFGTALGALTSSTPQRLRWTGWVGVQISITYPKPLIVVTE